MLLLDNTSGLSSSTRLKQCPLPCPSLRGMHRETMLIPRRHRGHHARSECTLRPLRLKKHLHICFYIQLLFFFNLCRHLRILSTPAPVAALQPTFLESVIATMTTSCCAPLVTCFTSTLANSLATPRCLAALKGDYQTVCGGVCAVSCQLKLFGWFTISDQGVFLGFFFL